MTLLLITLAKVVLELVLSHPEVKERIQRLLDRILGLPPRKAFAEAKRLLAACEAKKAKIVSRSPGAVSAVCPLEEFEADFETRYPKAG